MKKIIIFLMILLCTETVFADEFKKNTLAPQLALPKINGISNGYTLSDYLKSPKKFESQPGNKLVLNNGKAVYYQVFNVGYAIALVLTDAENTKFSMNSNLYNDGMLTDIIIITRNLENRIEVDRSIWKGIEFFDLTMLFFGKRIKSIKGFWSTGLPDNLNTVNKLTRQGVPLDKAITKTWTSRASFKHGFKRIVKEKVLGEIGNYSTIQCIYLPADEILIINSSI
ncbi:MAG: hypothetical protein ABIG64_09685 [Candidatus Omnitrophota bacterium]